MASSAADDSRTDAGYRAFGLAGAARTHSTVALRERWRAPVQTRYVCPHGAAHIGMAFAALTAIAQLRSNLGATVNASADPNDGDERIRFFLSVSCTSLLVHRGN